jgi:phage shock protein A
VKQFAKLKEARKKLSEKVHRLEKRIGMMNSKINSQGLENKKMMAQAKRQMQPVNEQSK